jgi:ATP-binding cassette subfamily B protein
MAMMMPSVMLVMNISSVAVIWFGANRIADGTLTLGAMIAFLSYLTQILLAVMMATWMAALIPRAAVCADRIQEVLDTDTSVVISPTAVNEVRSRGVVEMRNVAFAYPGAEAPVVCNVSFTSLPGQTTAIVAAPAQADDIISLVPRLFGATEAPSSSTASTCATSSRGLVGPSAWCPKPYLFSGTVASNHGTASPARRKSRCGKRSRSRKPATSSRVPGGLEASISQGGTSVSVSGGAGHRSSRHSQAEIYLFDDSFSALDLATDARLRAALAPHLANSTVLVVAQRISTILTADQILVLDDGVPVGLGPHSELLTTCPTYAEIVSSQMSSQDAA